MRIHTTATREQVAAAIAKSGAYAETLTEHGSRKSARAFEVKLTGNSRRRPNDRGQSDGYAATWDQWGVMFGELYKIDPDASCWAYDGVATFHTMTDWRFEYGTPSDMHGDHKWEIIGVREQGCKRCTAVRRF